MLKKNSRIIVDIEDVSGDGSGIAHFDGQVIFVPYTARGDRVEITIIKVLKNYCVGKIINIITPSPYRIVPDCKAYGRCGGCVFGHVALSEEERIKTEQVRSAMKRIGRIDVEVKDCVTRDAVRYRNKAQMPITEDENGIGCGFFANHSHRIVRDSIDCAIAPEIFSEISKFIVEHMEQNGISGYNEEENSGVIRHLYFRINKHDEIMLTIVSAKRCIIDAKTESTLVRELISRFPQVVSVFVNFNPENTNVILGDDYRLIYGKEYFEDELLETRLIMTPSSFFQVNRAGAELLYSTAFSLLERKHYENVYDLYCGIGSIGLTLFNQIKSNPSPLSANRLFGIEIVEDAIVCAKENARQNGIENTTFVASDSTDITGMDLFDKFPPSLVILDPPRKGTTEKLLTFLAEKGVQDILYISCDPATLARDMGYLYSLGYTSSAVSPINLFPRTKHVECAVRLCRT